MVNIPIASTKPGTSRKDLRQTCSVEPGLESRLSIRAKVHSVIDEVTSSLRIAGVL